LKYQPLQRPSCILLDVFLPHFDGFALQARLSGNGAVPPIIFITGHGDVPMSVKAIKKGAVDFLLKPFNKKTLHAAIINALELDKQNLKEEYHQKKICDRIAVLTPREKEVMHEVITGKLNKQIAIKLGTAEKTIRKHRGRVMKKLGLSSVAELVRNLEKVGIVANGK
jgi:FixJ family two-component response regulator